MTNLILGYLALVGAVWTYFVIGNYRQRVALIAARDECMETCGAAEAVLSWHLDNSTKPQRDAFARTYPNISAKLSPPDGQVH